jgi:hypothetical protein
MNSIPARTKLVARASSILVQSSVIILPDFNKPKSPAYAGFFLVQTNI